MQRKQKYTKQNQKCTNIKYTHKKPPTTTTTTQLTQSGVANLEREGSNVADTSQELGLQLAQVNLQDRGLVDGTILEDLQEDQPVREGRDVKHVQESGLGGTDLVTLLDQVDIIENFNGTTSDLGGDSKSLEEAGLLGTHASVAGGHPHIHGGNGTSLGRGLHLDGEDQLLDLTQIILGEDKADVATDVWHQP